MKQSSFHWSTFHFYYQFLHIHHPTNQLYSQSWATLLKSNSTPRYVKIENLYYSPSDKCSLIKNWPWLQENFVAKLQIQHSSVFVKFCSTNQLQSENTYRFFNSLPSVPCTIKISVQWKVTNIKLCLFYLHCACYIWY